VAKKSKQVLKQYRVTAADVIKKRGVKVTVGQQHGYAGRQNR
jgi:hypothetical protein